MFLSDRSISRVRFDVRIMHYTSDMLRHDMSTSRQIYSPPSRYVHLTWPRKTDVARRRAMAER